MRMEAVLTGLRAVGESTRLRILFVLAHGELNVSELTMILGQSQPRVSRHLKLMSDAGLLERNKEGSWVLFRLRDTDEAGELASLVANLLDRDDPILSADMGRLQQVLETRKATASGYFRANAANWDRIRSLHIAEQEVESAILRLLDGFEPAVFLDLGTGTGRVLELLANQAGLAIGLDASIDMLNVARSNIDAAGLRTAQVRQGDIYTLPYPEGFADLVTIHQVLHFLDDPGRAVREAARVLKSGGRLLIVDFAPHVLEFLRDDHAHRRLGIAEDAMAEWLKRAGLELHTHETLRPPAEDGADGLTVSIWLASQP